MKTLVITGGIGSGKSVVCRYFASKGIPVYDSDSRTKELYDTDYNLVSTIESAMGRKVTDDSGRIDRKALSSVIFSSPEKLSILESIVHPAVKSDFISWRNACHDVPFVVMESAIVLEKPLFNDISDKVLLVDAPFETRLQRACKRDGTDRNAIMSRMENQKLLNDISNGKTRPMVDFLIVNDSDMDSLLRQADCVYDSFCI